MKLIAFVTICLAVVGCKKESTSIGSDNPSQFADELGTFTASFPGASPPSKAVSLEWSFQQGQNFSYDYVHSIRNTTDDDDVEVDGLGTINLVPKSDGTADATIAAKLTLKVDGHERIHDAPPMNIHGIQKNGSAEKGENENAALLAILLPLPGKPVTQGEKVTSPFVMPMNGPSGPSTTEGTSTIWLEKYVKCGLASCALLRSEISMPRRKVMDESSFFELTVRGTTVYDLGAKAIHEVKMTAVLNLESELNGMPFSMKQDHYIRVKRR